jgi:hypothetical protein
MANTIIMDSESTDNDTPPSVTKLNTNGYTILAFTNIELRQLLKEELKAINIADEYVNNITNKILIKLNDNPTLIANFLNNKKEHIKDTKKNIKEIKKNTPKGKLVKIAKTPKQTKPTNDVAPDYSSLEYLSQLKLTDLKPILAELSKNRNDTKKFVNKKEIIEQIIELSTTTKLPLEETNVEQSSPPEDDNVSSPDEHQPLLQIEPKSHTPKKVKSRA